MIPFTTWPKTSKSSSKCSQSSSWQVSYMLVSSASQCVVVIFVWPARDKTITIHHIILKSSDKVSTHLLLCLFLPWPKEKCHKQFYILYISSLCLCRVICRDSKIIWINFIFDSTNILEKAVPKWHIQSQLTVLVSLLDC